MYKKFCMPSEWRGNIFWLFFTAAISGWRTLKYYQQDLCRKNVLILREERAPKKKQLSDENLLVFFLYGEFRVSIELKKLETADLKRSLPRPVFVKKSCLDH